jgi:hypothetical protein
VFATLRNKRGHSNSTHITVGQKISQKGHRFWPRNSQLLKKSLWIGPISVKWKRKPSLKYCCFTHMGTC